MRLFLGHKTSRSTLHSIHLFILYDGSLKSKANKKKESGHFIIRSLSSEGGRGEEGDLAAVFTSIDFSVDFLSSSKKEDLFYVGVVGCRG